MLQLFISDVLLVLLMVGWIESFWNTFTYYTSENIKAFNLFAILGLVGVVFLPFLGVVLGYFSIYVRYRIWRVLNSLNV